MNQTSHTIVSLSEMTNGQEADLFALLSAKEELKTRDGKPYFRVTFRDARREVQFPIWNDSPWGSACRDKWQPGMFFKLRAEYRETQYGPQLEIRKLREATESDQDDGFDPALLRPGTRFNTQEMFDELCELVKQNVIEDDLRSLTNHILDRYHEQIVEWAAATRNHHAFAGGYLEHVLSVTRTAVFLANKYDDYYPDMEPRLSKSLVVAGAVLHDIGKIRELDFSVEATKYSATGQLVGHILQGRDIVREAATEVEVASETLLRLEHIIISHQRLPEWGSPKPPMTPEALIVHYADDLDAKYHMMYAILQSDSTDGPLTSRKNVLNLAIFRGLDEPSESDAS